MQGDFLVNTDRTEATKTEYSTKRVSNKGHPAPSACPCWGGALHKLGEDVTETLELVPRQWKVIQHVREKYSCRSCEKITQPPAHVLFGKYGLHLPLTRQSATYAREGVPLDVSTLTDWVGASAATFDAAGRGDPCPRVRGRAHPCRRDHGAGARHRQDPTGRLWTYVRDDRPFAGADPPAAAYFYSPDRGGVHPEARRSTP